MSARQVATVQCERGFGLCGGIPATIPALVFFFQRVLRLWRDSCYDSSTCDLISKSLDAGEGFLLRFRHLCFFSKSFDAGEGFLLRFRRESCYDSEGRAATIPEGFLLRFRHLCFFSKSFDAGEGFLLRFRHFIIYWRHLAAKAAKGRHFKYLYY